MRTITERYGTFGWEEFLETKDRLLAELDSAKAKGKNRPTQIAHGPAIEAAIRAWLSEFLPKKYAVTSGYVIPDVRTGSYEIQHFDIIVYDQLNAPVLWGESTHDDSALGRRRAMPAPYVHAIIEAKASLTKRSIEDALRKLREVNDFAEKGRPSFCCGIVFAEVKRGLLRRSALIEEVRALDITGYFGGIVLRAESLEPRLAGYFTFLDSEKSEPMMPLARDPGGLVIDEENRPVLTEQGDVAEVVVLEGKWNFDKGYSPLVRGVHLLWSYNSFPRFALDLLERLDGVYNPRVQKKRMHYGMSYYRRPEA